MTEKLKEEFKRKDLSKLRKIQIFKSKESEEIIEGIILNPDEVTQEEYIIQKPTKGKTLKKGLLIKGSLEVLLTKSNYEKLYSQNEANKTEALNNGTDINDFVDMFTLVTQERDMYKVLL